MLRRAALLFAFTALLATATPPAVQAQDAGGCPAATANGSPLTLSTARRGLVDLAVVAAPGSTIAIGECTRLTREPITSTTASGERTAFDEAAVWTCERVYRQFYATIRAPDGSESTALTDVRTPLCTDRFTLAGPRRVKVGQTVKTLLTDTWGTGNLRGRFCVTSPTRAKQCKDVRLAVAQRKLARSFKATTRGTWTVQFARAGVVETVRVAAGAKAGSQAALPTVLATGDSKMLGVSNLLADELAGEASVLDRTQPGSGISAAGNLWPGLAASQVKLKPRLVVWSVGAAEGYPMNDVDCCGEAWQAEYLARLRQVVATYRKAGAKVLLLTVPVPRDPRRVEIVTAATAMILKVGADTSGVGVERIDQLVSPNGFAETIRYGGKNVAIRAADGVHLNRAGQAIEARAVAATVRKLLKR